MAIRNLTPEELLAEYGKIKEKNKGKDREPRTSTAREELIGAIKTLMDVEFASDEFNSKGFVVVAPADFGEAIYDDWKTLVGKDKAPTKAYRVRSIRDCITDYVKKKGYYTPEKPTEGGKGKRTIMTIYKEEPKEETKPAAPKAAKAKK